MTATKVIHREKVLDLNRNKRSRNALKRRLKNLKLRSRTNNLDTIYLNVIKIGIFDIYLNIFNFYGLNQELKLSDINDFYISICECNTHYAVKNEILSKFDIYNRNYNIEELIEIINYCDKVTVNKAFL